MIELHYFEHSRSQRMLWFAEELGLTYRLVKHRRDPQTQLASEEAKALHPLGKFPILVHGDHVIAESAVILEYMARFFGEATWVVNIDDTNYWSFQYWMHYAEASLMPPLIIRLIFSKLKGPQVPALIRPLSRRIADQVDQSFTLPQIRTHFAFVESHLRGREWFVGDRMTIADVQMHFPLEAALAKRTIKATDYPAINQYVERLQARPAYLRALDKAGEYDFGPSR